MDGLSKVIFVKSGENDAYLMTKISKDLYKKVLRKRVLD